VNDEHVLPGGVANAGRVVRIGAHVLRPASPHTRSIHRFLHALRATGFDGVPQPVGVDPDGRERLEFIEGEVAVPPYPAWVQHDDALASLADLLHRFHDASRRVDATGSDWSDEMADPAGGVLVCHNDVCLENIVFRDGEAVGLVDFDFAAPGRPEYDLAQMARMCVPIDDDVNAPRLGWQPVDRPSRLRLVADAYGLDRERRREMLSALSESIDRGGEFVRRRVEAGDPNFVRMWDDMGGRERFDRRRRWWRDTQADFAAALA
jgi:aminoglycoside phosphotransferase (APT) family kinase protein